MAKSNITTRVGRGYLVGVVLLALLPGMSTSAADLRADGASSLYERQRLQRDQQARRLERANERRSADTPRALPRADDRVLRRGLTDLQNPPDRAPDPAGRQRLERDVAREVLRPVLDHWARPAPTPSPDLGEAPESRPLQTRPTPPPWIVLPRHNGGSR